MARLASAEKGGFYPLPSLVTDLLLTHLAAPQGGRVLDPCAGAGVALAALAAHLDLEAYGAELHSGRAGLAQEHLAPLSTRTGLPLSDPHVRRFLAGDYRSVQTAKHGFNLLYLNPPYDTDHEAGRLEYQWLRDTTPWLQPGGVLALVVPQHVLGYPQMARYLAAWYRDTAVWRFPDDEYAAFAQIVLLGYRQSGAVAPEEAVTDRYHDLSRAGAEIAVFLAAAEPTFSLPRPLVAPAQFYFRGTFVEPEDALAEAAQVGVRQGAAWQAHLTPRHTARVAVEPLVPLKVGHLAGLLAAGFLDHQRLSHGAETLLIKGRAWKQVARHEQRETKPDGSEHEVVTHTEQVVVDITTLAPDGTVQGLRGAELQTFLERWLDPLTAQIAQQYPPAYRFELGRYAAPLAALSQGRRIPFTDRSGLMPAQQHAAAACALRLQHHKDAILVGECGTGKAQPLDAKVLTPTGWKPMGSIAVGDEVVNPAGGTAHVVGVFPQGEKDIYRVTFSDGSSTECCDEHLWQVLTPERKWRGHSPQVFALGEIRNRHLGSRGNYRYFVPLVAPVDYPARALPLDPYLLGALLGDGGLSDRSVMFSTADEELRVAVETALPEGVSLRYQSQYDYRLRSDPGIPNLVLNALRELELFGRRSHEKFIPERYMHAPLTDRLALLQGLLDTDGTVGRGYDVEFSSASERLARGVQGLVQSMGGTTRLRTKQPSYTYKGEHRQGRLAYRLSIVLPAGICPFRLSRKANAYRPGQKYGPSRAIAAVELVGRKPAQCIALNSTNQLYVTDDYIVTHNTSAGIAVAALLGARRTIVLCPPHLVDKWQREARIVWPEVETCVLATISDVAHFFGPSDQPRVGVLSHSRAKLASGWRHACDDWAPTPRQIVARYAPHLGGQLDAKALEAYYETNLAARVARYTKRRGLRCPDCGVRLLEPGSTIPLSRASLAKRSTRLRCFRCAVPLHSFDRQLSAKQQPGSFREYARREAQVRAWLAGNPGPGSQPPTFRPPSGVARSPLARYIRAHHTGALDLLLADELHQFKGDDTDQGYAFADLAVAARKVLGLTGTIYGGKASSLFHLLYRLAPQVRATFTDTEQTGRRRIRTKEWLIRYGVLQEIETTRVKDKDGKLTANPRSTTRTRELPGGSPAMLPWLLNRAVFLSLADLGFALPSYEEIPVAVELSPEMEMRYRQLEEDIQTELAQRLVRGDKSLLGAYVQSLNNWVDGPWRDEKVLDPYDKRDGRANPQVIAHIRGLDAAQVFPKEAAVIRQVLAERAEGRRCALYIQQTETRDITPRWQALLTAAGLKSAVLKCAPLEREAWLALQVEAGVDVILTHPRRVETGLDLVAFPTLIWLSPDYSVYTTLQASRRAWRIGQDQPCKVFFYCYAGTLQADALRLIAAKVAATLRVSGDVVEEGLTELDELASTDMVTALAKLVVARGTGEAGSLAAAFSAASAEIQAAQQVMGGYTMTTPEPGIIEGEIVGEVAAGAPWPGATALEAEPVVPVPLQPALLRLPGSRSVVQQPALLVAPTSRHRAAAGLPSTGVAPAPATLVPEPRTTTPDAPAAPTLTPPLAPPLVGLELLPGGAAKRRRSVGTTSLWEALHAGQKEVA